MKGLKVEFTIPYDYLRQFNPVVGEVISEPYAKITSSFTCPDRSGNLQPTTNSQTCVVILGSNGELYCDIPVDNLKIAEVE